jgi:hypothetical protein
MVAKGMSDIHVAFTLGVIHPRNILGYESYSDLLVGLQDMLD